ncbi:GNAT family N-acetyltransferase [Floccifex sp.]|uniref:GNAT family N-acetyltransferase n=1 Tax=Floccifex sp. TaxID=2815810 RepID=UPI003F0A4A8D
MSKVNLAIPSIDAEMIIPKKTILKEMNLPEGYQYVSFTNQHQDKVQKLLDELNVNFNIDQIMQAQRTIFKEHCVLVEYQHELVACASLCQDEDACLYLAFVAVKEAHQHKGIGRAMVSRICKQFDRMKTRYPLCAKVNTQALEEIKLLNRMGFTPFLGETKNKSEQEVEQDWNVITELLRK